MPLIQICAKGFKTHLGGIVFAPMARSQSTINIPTFVKWAGGKRQLLRQFGKFFPEKIESYVEPFLGSGAVFFHLQQKHKMKRVILTDLNEELVNCFVTVRDHVNALIPLLEKHREKHHTDAKKHYYETRAIDLKTLSPLERTARVIYLNKTCFNGLYRVNSKGQFNVPIGSYKTPKIVARKKLLAASKLLQDTTLKCMSFEDIPKVTPKGSFVYMDPPYFPLSKTSSFTSYTKNSFGTEDQENLCKVFKAFDKKGCKVMLSNSDHPVIRSLYKKFRIETVSARRMINCKAKGRGELNELVILNFN